MDGEQPMRLEARFTLDPPATAEPLSWTLGPDVFADFDRASCYEWLETNGLGGFASGSATGAHTRRYHGLLVAALSPPVDRRVLLSRLDETLVTAAGRQELFCSSFPAGPFGRVVAPRGHRRLTSFRQEIFPTWEWEAGGAKLRKTVAALHGENTTVVVYELLASAGPCQLELMPFFACRDFHSLVTANDAVAKGGRFDQGVLVYRAYPGTPEIHLAVPGAGWEPDPDWWRQFAYAREEERGFDPACEDLFTPGHFRLQLTPGRPVAVIASLSDPRGRDGVALVAAEAARRGELMARFRSPLGKRLALAADQFIVRRGGSGGERRPVAARSGGAPAAADPLASIIAGYPWFADWGRDTMISLPGVCLATGRLEEARRILLAYSQVLSQGMLPNRFPEGGEAPEYNTVDAALWWFVAVWKYLQATAARDLAVSLPSGVAPDSGIHGRGDEDTVRALLPALDEVLAWYRGGTRHGIREAADGLLRAGEPGRETNEVQLTWMDARVGDRPVTPRHGKPVEIQALWLNAQRLRADLAERFGDRALASDLRRRCRIARHRFLALFWDDHRGYLADCVDDAGVADWTLRPNQLLTLSLPYPLLDRERGRRVLDLVERELLTAVGLRTLPPGDPRYVGRYEGGPDERDAAYHQGTAWSWLLGPFLTALVRQRGQLGREQGRALVAGMERHLGEAGVGSVSEIFDGDPPHAPRGCFAQAWGVAELLRAWVDDLGGD